ncbi:MAG: riboflavin kinase [Rikenellaceae bacterium]
MVVEGVVVEGRRMGHELGFPTANVNLQGCGSLRGGVYLSRVWVGGELYDGLSNVGVNPTVGEVPRRLECHILDFEGDIYGKQIRIELCEWLRGEIRFESIEALRQQIVNDVAMARSRVRR